MRILVIDDNWDHGNMIKQSLKNSGFKAEFFLYDENRLNQLPSGSAVRIIFSDLNLGGDGVSGTKDYAVVGAVIQNVIQERNGPYALISWTTFAEEAEGLLRYLRDRFPPHCHPVDFKVLAKEKFIIPGSGDSLKEELLNIFANFPAVRATLEWESNVNSATEAVFRKLEDIALIDGVDKFEKRLHQIYTKLAEAEGGPKAISRDDITHPLSLVLSRLLHDELTQYSIAELPAQKDDNFQNFNSKKSTLNSMLHVHTDIPNLGNVGSLPGLVFFWPMNGEVEGIPMILGESLKGISSPNAILETVAESEDRKEFKKYFLKKDVSTEDLAKCMLVMMDVTPTCDHSSNVNVWRRFIGGLLIPNNLASKCADTNGSGKLMRLPVVSLNNSEKFLVLNSQFYVAIPNGTARLQGFGEPLFQLREQIYSDILGWIGRQVSRQGYTSFN